MSMAKNSKSGKERKTAGRRTAATGLTSAAALLRSFPSGKLAAKGKDVAGKPAVESAFEAMMKSARPAQKPAPAVIKVGASAKPRRVERQQAREEWVDIFDFSPWTNTKSPQTGVVRTQAAHRTVRKHGVGAVLEGDMINPWLSSSENPDAASQSQAEEMLPVEVKSGETVSDDKLDMDRLRKQLTGDFGRQAIRELQLGGLTNLDKGDPMTPRKDETKTKTGTDGATAAPSKPSDWQTPAAAANAGKQAAQAKPARKTAGAAKAGKRVAAGAGKRPAAKAGKRPVAKAGKQVAAKVDKQAAAGVDKQAAAGVDKQAAQAKPALETTAAAQAEPAKKAAPETTSWTAKAKPPEQEEITVEDLFKGVSSFFGGLVVGNLRLLVAGISGLKKKLGKKDKADGQ
ncbi:MAG: hypothetical protein QF511_06595 [Rhodospirillales bacterium]|nr:hypothetical protein [Rhodospirillales bacterium]MDP7216319.1 hypothetical protein [Rhodospirillales bacterium]